MKHDLTLTASARSLVAAGRHLHRKSGGDALAVVSQQLAQHTDAVQLRLKAAESTQQDLKARIGEIEQLTAGRGFGASSSPATWGSQFVEEDGLKSFAADGSRPDRFRAEVKAVTAGPASGGAMGAAFRDAPATKAQRPMAVRDLLNLVQISSGSVEFARQTGRASAAAPVAEGALKPESDVAFELETTPVRVIAHWLAASRQILDDAPQLRDVIDGDLVFGLQLQEEVQLLNGPGTGATLHGMVPQATPFVAPFVVADATEIDTLGLAILQSALADFPATGIILHPSDWTRMRLLKAEDGRYLLGAPGQAVVPELFGLPVVTTQAMTAGSFLVGDFRRAATLYDRWLPRVEVSTAHADFFVRNLVAILAEIRIALAVRQPLALTHGNF